ncbi:acyltransferase [Archangium lansingense]|uniref:Acyltransferase n=1 Tax=Archangium lansingense TaxID=2995310 RepID=A0ABT4A9S7_9BACT|nr:acyltransferase [Archangium lansinium]MCY1078422.1 acyltransferase [Archangium lansinium]
MMDSLSHSALDGLFAGPDDLPIEFAFFYERLPEAELLAEGLARTLPAFPRLQAAVSLRDVPGVELPSDDKVSRAGLFDVAEPGPGRPLCRLKVSRFGAGGCLGASMSHVLGDGVSLVGFLSAWARSVRGQAPAAPVSSELPTLPAGALDGSRSLEEELGRAGFRLGSPPPHRRREDFTWDIRRFSREEVDALVREARASQPQVTSADVLAAFLWRLYHPPSLEGTAEPELGIIFDFRRIPGLLPASYFGTAGLPLRVPLSPQEASTLSLPEIAARIRARLQSASATEFFRYHALMEEVRRTQGQEGLDRLNASAEDHGLLINNISRFDLSLLDFGTGAPHTFDVLTPKSRMCFIVTRGDSLEAHTSLPRASGS